MFILVLNVLVYNPKSPVLHLDNDHIVSPAAEHKQLHHDNAERRTFGKQALKGRFYICLGCSHFYLHQPLKLSLLLSALGIWEYPVFVSFCPKVNVSCLAQVTQEKTPLY